jgi:hypothetical protein
MIQVISTFILVFGAYLLVHNEWILHDNNLTKRFEVISFRCLCGGVLIAAGVTGLWAW